MKCSHSWKQFKSQKGLMLVILSFMQELFFFFFWFFKNMLHTTAQFTAWLYVLMIYWSLDKNKISEGRPNGAATAGRPAPELPPGGTEPGSVDREPYSHLRDTRAAAGRAEATFGRAGRGKGPVYAIPKFKTTWTLFLRYRPFKDVQRIFFFSFKV